MLAFFALAPVFCTIVSQSLTDLFAFIFVIYSVYFIYKTGDLTCKSVLRSFYTIFFLAWVAWIFISFVFGANSYEHLIDRVLEFRWYIYVICFFFLLKSITEKNSKNLLYLISFICILNLHGFVFGKDFVTGEAFSGDMARVGGFIHDPMTLSHALAVFGMFFFGYFTYLKSFKSKTLVAALGILFLVTFLTLTRGVWVAIIAAFAFYFLIRSWRHLFVFIILTGLAGGIAYKVSDKFKTRIDQTINYQQSYDTERIVLWKTNLFIFEKNPVFGIGYGENKYRLREFYDVLGVPPNQFLGNAHNQFINFLAGTGFLGLVFYLVWLLANMYFAYDLFRNTSVMANFRALGLGSFLAQIVFAVGGLTEANFEHSRLKTLMSFIWAISLYGYYIRQKAKRGRKPEVSDVGLRGQKVRYIWNKSFHFQYKHITICICSIKQQ